MNKAECALNAILQVGIEEEPEAALLAKAHALVDIFKAHCAAEHLPPAAGTAIADPRVTEDLMMLCELVDRELDRRLDEDLTDTVTDVLEDVCLYLHRETRAPDCHRPWAGEASARLEKR